MPIPLLAAGAAALARFGPALVAGGQVAGGIRQSMPTLEDEVVVEVVGQPGSKRKDLYYLALSAAFSVVKRFDAAQFLSPPPGLLMVEYGLGTEAENHSIRVTLRFRTSLLSSAVWNSITSLPGTIAGAVMGGGPLPAETAGQGVGYAGSPGAVSGVADLAIYAGPKDQVVGAPFGLTGLVTPGVPRSSTSSAAPQLPFANRVILTKSTNVQDPNPAIADPRSAPTIASANPRPPGDNRSRGSIPRVSQGSGVVETFLVPLVHAAISNPASAHLQTFPPPTAGPNGN